MIGKITNHGVVSGRRFSQGKQFYLVNSANCKASWVLAEQVAVLGELQASLKDKPLRQFLTIDISEL